MISSNRGTRPNHLLRLFVAPRLTKIGNRRSNSALAFKGKGKDQDPDNKGMDGSLEPKSLKGGSFENPDRRRGRPAHLRSPEDSPLRDANRDIMLGVLTARSARTLIVYLQETNLHVCQWLVNFMYDNPITLTGTWEDVSGDTFLRKLLSMPIEEATLSTGVGSLYSNSSSCDVDPRSIAQRILNIRSQLAIELIQDLKLVQEDNNELLRQSLRASLESCMKMPVATGASSPEASAPGLSPVSVMEDLECQDCVVSEEEDKANINDNISN